MREVRYLLSLSIVTILFAVLPGGAIVATQNPIHAAFLGVANESGYGGALLKSKVAEALLSAMNASEVFRIIDAQDETLSSPDATNPTEVASKSRFPAVVRAVVKKVSIHKPKRSVRAEVSVETVLVMEKMPQLVFRAFAEGEGDDLAENRAVSEAISAAAFEIAKQLSTVVSLRGQVLLPPTYAILPSTHYRERDRIYDRAVRISLGITSGLKVGSEAVILRGDDIVARGQVVEVDIGSSLVALTEVKPGIQIRSGDKVVVTFVPQHPTELPLPLEKEREYKRVEHDFAWALAIAGIAIGLLAE